MSQVKITTAAILAAALATVGGAACAQDAMFSTLASDTANNLRNTSIRDSMLGVDSLRARGRSPSTSIFPRGGYAGGSVRGPAAPPPRLTSTRYHDDPAVTARVQRQFVDYVRKQTGSAGGADMERAFRSRDLRRWWAEAAAPDGMRPGDVADAMTEYWVTNWLIAQQRTDASPSQYRAVRARLEATMGANPAFARLGDGQRQEMAEVLMYNTLVQAQAYQNAVKSGDRALVGRLGDSAVARFRNEMNVDLRHLSLTEQGFVRRG